MLPMNLLRLALLALMLFAVTGCGYGFKQQGASVLPDGMTNLFIDKVENPTTEAWLGPRLRTLLRDELTKRGRIRWTDRAHADGLVTITVLQFTRESTVKDDTQDTTKYASTTVISASIRDKDTGALIWEATPVGSSNRYYGTDSASKNLADEDSALLAVRFIVDQMEQGY